jgi:amino acid adenylation domain-containing protein
MTVNELLIQLRQKEVDLWVEDGRLQYQAPDGALTPALLEAVRESREELIEFLQAATRETPAERPAIRPVPRTDRLPLSFAQQRLWLLDQLEPDAATYNIPSVLEMTGPLDKPALERALSEIVRRHEALRTAFSVTDGAEPVQVISPAVPVTLPVVDLRDVPVADRRREADQRIKADARQPFDLAHGPLLRLQLLRLGDEEHLLQLNVHHIVSDGWSAVVFARELSALYKAFVAGRPSPLPELPVQYADYAVWQRNWLRGEVLDEQLNYWKKQLAGSSFALELPTDFSRPPVQTYHGAALSVEIPKDLTDRLRALSQREGATLYMTLLAAFQVLLHRYSGQDDLLVASPSAGRDGVEMETMIGFFVNTMALRGNLAGNPTFRTLLHQIRETALGAFAHRDIPFEKLVEELQPVRQMNRSPLCQVMFVLQNTPAQEFQLPRLRVSSRLIEVGESKFDLTLEVEEMATGLRCHLDYCTDLFAEDRMRRLLGHYQTLLEGIAANPDQRLGELPLLTPAERQQLLVEWNATAVDYPRDVCLHTLFERQVQKTPDAVAVVFGDQQLTYRELDARANQLAHHLITLGVKTESFVGVCCERSLEMVIALYGILKAGAAYVPIDPSYPADRLTFMLSDAATPVLLTQAKLRDKLPPQQGRVVCLDADWPEIARQSPTAPVTGVAAENLAYMIYTSGSTGKPKGAMNVHRGIVNRLLWMQDAYQLTAADVVLQKTPFSFDVSVWEFFWPLLVGAQLVVAKPDGHRDPDYLVNLIVEKQVTVLHFVPSMLQYFLAADDVERCRSLRHVICSGEALSYELQERFFTRLGAQLQNLYGPTEAAVDVTAWTCPREGSLRFVPIGKPIANTQTYILDKNLTPLPIGVPGELHLGGVQVGRGYHNRPELTAEKFIPDPFRREPGARLYKTGDLCRFLPDGNIEYLGRLDRQVKIRGFRIELGEIQAVLEQHPQVRESVVVAREDAPGDKRIVAYVVGKNSVGPNAAELREFIGQKLPEYMVPSAFVRLWMLPLSPNGKVDVRALPVPQMGNGQPAAERVAPRTATEKLVAGIWQELLRVPPMCIHDSFFALGGHSLLAVQAITRLRAALKLELPLRVLFEKPTVAELASHLDSLVWAQQSKTSATADRGTAAVVGEL